MVMASASMPARRRMGACETTPPATPGDNHATLRKPARKDPFLASDDPSPLSGVQLVRPRRCAAPGAPAGPRPHGDATRVAARKIPKIVRPSPERHHASHRVKPLCPLDTDGPHGCRCGRPHWDRTDSRPGGLDDGSRLEADAHTGTQNSAAIAT